MWELIKHMKTDKLGTEHVSSIVILWLPTTRLPPSQLDCRKENTAALLLERERCIYSNWQSLIAQWTQEQWLNCDKLEVGSKYWELSCSHFEFPCIKELQQSQSRILNKKFISGACITKLKTFLTDQFRLIST